MVEKGIPIGGQGEKSIASIVLIVVSRRDRQRLLTEGILQADKGSADSQ